MRWSERCRRDLFLSVILSIFRESFWEGGGDVVVVVVRFPGCCRRAAALRCGGSSLIVTMDRFGEERSSRRRGSDRPRRSSGSRRLSTESSSSTRSTAGARQEDDALTDARVDAFLEVMSDKSRTYAKEMVQRADNNVEQAILMAMEDPASHQEDESSEHAPPPPHRSITPPTSETNEEGARIKAFLEVIPDGGSDFAKKMLERADNNVQQALNLAMEQQPPADESPPLQQTSSPPRSPRRPPQHQTSLTTSDLHPSDRFLDAHSESTRFMQEFSTEVPTFRDYESPPASPGSRNQSFQSQESKPSIRRSSKTGSSRPSSSVQFSDERADSLSVTGTPNGAFSNSDALVKMARSATATKQASIRSTSSDGEAKVKRKAVHVGWNEDLYIMGGDDDGRSPTHSPPNEPQRQRSIEDIMHAFMPSLSYGPTPSIMAPPRRKNTLIVDKKKRDTRWQWAQEIVSKSFKPYRTMLSEKDDLLPDQDEFEAFEESGATADKDFEDVRDCMLDDLSLSEREVAAFFEGFALFNVKIQSLQSQLDSLKAVKRAEPRSVMSMHAKSFSASRSISTIAAKDPMDVFSQSISAIPTNSGASEKSEHMDSPRMLGESSLRHLSIKKVQTEHSDNDEVQRLLKELEDADKKQKKLEKQLQQAGVIIAEDIPYEEAKSEVESIAKRMGEIGSSEVTHPDKAEQAKLREEYFKLEQEMEKYNAALMLTDEYIEEQEELEQKWEDDHIEENLAALKKLRRHMPVNVKSLSEAELSSNPSPNGKVLPKDIARKFKRTNVLQLIRTDPKDLVRMHPAALENLRVTGLTLTERRAIYAHIKDVGPRWKAMQADKMTERKWTWFKMMKQNFKENLDMYEYHVQQYGSPGNHPYATRDNPREGCPLVGKQCPIKADKQIDYDNDYGYTDEAKYEVSNVRKSDKEDPGAKAKREAMELARDKKANERSVGLKKHYKGKVLQVSLANGSCENMDEILDRIEMLQTKWIEERLSHEGEELTEDDKRKELTAFAEALNELKLGVLHLAERSGMQLTGKKDANADNPDKRSAIELGLCEEVYDSCIDFFAGMNEHMQEMKVKDKRLRSTIDQLRELLDELHDRNVATLKELHRKRPALSRKHKTYKEIQKEAKGKTVAASAGAQGAAVEESGPPPGAGDRGGLMAAIAGRGGSGGRGPPGGLMDAIKAGRGGRGGPGRGAPGLMDAIKGRGAGSGGRGPPGGRGGLLAAIEGRGRGGGGRGPPGLKDAIKQRGCQGAESSGQSDAGGSQGRGRGGGGRCDLMSAIAGRGKIE